MEILNLTLIQKIKIKDAVVKYIKDTQRFT